MTEPSDSRASFRALLRRLWAATLTYKGMVVAMLGFAALEAAFTKLPLVLVQPLMTEMGAKAGAPPQVPKDFGGRLMADFEAWFRVFAEDLATFLGIQVEPAGMRVVIACAVVAVACGFLGAVTIYFVQTISRFFAIRIVADLRCE
ncbi:MAG TPA: hypothetical protein VFT55_17950, partial [Planctomycetota bacterium]|nr:hypothetical protein [Planctomycetota bacterium]